MVGQPATPGLLEPVSLAAVHGAHAPAIGAAASPAFDFDQQQPAGFLDQQIDFAPPAAPIANHQSPTLLLQEP
jgi:hypothetical protein